MGLVLWMPCTKDLHNQGLVGTNPTGTCTYEDGKIGNCAKVTSTIDTGLSSDKWDYSTKSISFGGWFKFNKAEMQAAVLNKSTNTKQRYSSFNLLGKDSYNGFALSLYTNNIYNPTADLTSLNIQAHMRSSTASWACGFGTIEWDTWIHLFITWDFDSKTFTAYKNGAKMSSWTISNWGGDFTYRGAFNIAEKDIFGGNGPAVIMPFRVNDVRVYDHCLSPKEVKEIAKGLVLHYPLNDAYVEGTSNLFSADLTYHTNWNNSGSATWSWDDNTIPKINNSIIYSISRTDTGNSAIGCGRCNLVAGKTYTASVYVYLSGNTDSNIFYVRSVNTHVSDLKYNNDANPQKWPQNQWIRATATFTPSAAYNSCYICTYLDYANSKRALTCWQIEEKDHATPYTPNTRNETTVYDCSGYQNNGTINGSLSCSTDSPRYKISTHFTSSIPSRINLPSDMSCLSGNNEQTLSCWVKSSGLGSGMLWSGLISLGYGNTLFLGTSYYGYRIDNGSDLGIIGANQNPHDGKWHLVTATYKSGIASIYIDGVLKNNVSRTFSNRYINTGGNRIGTEVNNSPVYNLNGDISDIRMYTTALSADDIKELYNTSAYVSDNGTLLTYNLEE